MGYDRWNMSPGGWILLVLFWIALITVIVVGIVALIRMWSRPAHAPGPPPHTPGPHPVTPALQILDERFARGEIDVDEYRLRGTELRRPGEASNPPPPQKPPA